MPYTLFHIDSERGLRGGERQVLYLASWLAARGHHNVIVCRRGEALEKAARERKLETLTLPFFMEWDPISALLLRRRLEGSTGAIVHAHSGHGAAMAWMAARGNGVRRVAHRRVAEPLRGPLSARLKYGTADRVIAITEAVKQILVDAGVESGRVVVIPSSIEPELVAKQAEVPRDEVRQAYSAEQGVDWEADWVGTVCALDRSKGVAPLLRAARIVLDRRPKTAFFIAGDGSERGRLEALSESLGINTKVRFMGQRSDNVQILKSLDLFVLPSLLEGMGSVLLEAAACGVPRVATRVGGIPEVVEDGVSGLLVPPNDPKALADALLRLLEDRALAGRLAAEATKRLDRFTVERMGEATESVYKQLMGDA